MVAEKDNNCVGCGAEYLPRPGPGLGLRPGAGHPHRSTVIRGILCNKCLRILEAVKNDEDILPKLAGFVKHWRPLR